MLKGGGKVTTAVWKLWSGVAIVANILQVADQLMHEWTIRMGSKFC